MSTRLILKKAEVTDHLFSKVEKLKSLAGFANRVLYQEYRKVQLDRWESENASEGERWARLQPTYRKQKLTVYRGYPYSGTRVGVATGQLLKSVVGPHPKHRKLPQKRGFQVFTAVEYAEQFDELRPFTTYSDKTREKFADMIRDYLK